MALTPVPASGDSVGKALLVVDWGFWFLSVVAVALRMWARSVKRQRPRFDDYCCFVALVFIVMIAICHTFAVIDGGLGLPATEVSPESLVLSLKIIPATEVAWSLCNTAVKLSFLYFFAKVFSLEKYRPRFLAVGYICIALGVANIIQCLAVCRPFAFNWDKTIEGGVCGEVTLGILLVAFFNLFTDLLVFSLPVPILWSLRVSAKKRRGLIMTFCLGVFVCCITILRIVFTFLLINDPTNETYWVGVNAMFLTLEPCLGVIAASVPTWKPLLVKQGLAPNMIPSSGDRSNAATGRSKRNTKSFIRLDEFNAKNDSDNKSELGLTSKSEAGTTWLDTTDDRADTPPHGITVTTDVYVQRSEPSGTSEAPPGSAM